MKVEYIRKDWVKILLEEEITPEEMVVYMCNKLNEIPSIEWEIF